MAEGSQTLPGKAKPYRGGLPSCPPWPTRRMLSRRVCEAAPCPTLSARALPLAARCADQHEHVAAHACLQRGGVHPREQARGDVVGVEAPQGSVEDDDGLTGEPGGGWGTVFAAELNGGDGLTEGGASGAPMVMRQRMAASVLRLAKGKPGSEGQASGVTATMLAARAPMSCAGRLGSRWRGWGWAYRRRTGGPRRCGTA